MARLRRQTFRAVRKPANTSYIETAGPITLAAGVTANYTLILASDSPNKALVADMAGVLAQCENNSRITKGSFIDMSFFTGSAFAVVNVWAYLNPKGMITAPTTGYDFNQAPTTEDNAQLRKQTIFYKRFVLTFPESRHFRFRLGGKRNNYLTDGSNLVIVVQNAATASTLSFHAYGRIRTIEG